MENTRATVSGKTSPERSQATKDTTSSPCSKPSRKLPTPKFMCLNLNKRHVGQDLRGNPLVMWLEMGGASLGEQLMLNTGEYPNVVVESTLSQILQENVPTKYYLSSTACRGILNRAIKRGKKLPDMLEEALIECVVGSEVNFGPKDVTDAIEILRKMREEIGTEAAKEWISGTFVLVQQEKVLQPELCESKENTGRVKGELRELVTSNCKKNDRAGRMRRLLQNYEFGNTSLRWGSVEQYAYEFDLLMQKLSCEKAQNALAMYCMRKACESKETMHEALSTIQERQIDKRYELITAESENGTEENAGVKCLNPWDSQTIRQYDASGIYPALSANSGGGQKRDGVVYPDIARTLTA